MDQKHATCDKPDVDCPKLVCGYPIPCPHHTYQLDIAKVELTIPQGPTARIVLTKFRGPFKRILDALKRRKLQGGS